MKKLLGGIFQKQKDQQQSPGAALSPQDKTPPSSSASGQSKTTNGARRAASPATHENVYKNGPRSNWDSFFTSPSSMKAPSSPPPVPTTMPSIPVPAKIFNQNLEMLMREIVARTKLVITKMIQDAEFQNEFAQLCGFINLAADKLLEKDDPSLVLLKNYFSSPAGLALCEQTAFPSLVLDFVNKVRIYLIKNELKRMDTASPRASSSETSAADLERPIHFLMSCLQAIASNVMLMELFRCELPNVIYLTAEEYPQSALYLRDMSSQVLASISDKNFNAGLVWYLNDCNTIARTVRLMARYGDVRQATPTTAAEALRALITTTKSPIADPQSSTKDPIAAAVGDALGLNRSPTSATTVVTQRMTAVQSGDDAATEQDEDQTGDPVSAQYLLVGPYDPLPGVKSLVYALQKTCRFSLVLLGEFQSSGGYELLSNFVKKVSESQVSNLIYLFTLLLPLGTGFAGVCGDDDNMATIITCGARNIGAFLTMRDLVLESMNELKAAQRAADHDAKARLELLLLQLLTTILQVYTSAYDNFLCLEQKTQALAMMLSKLPTVDFFDARVIILRIVEYVCVAAKADSLLPIEILAVLCSQFVEFSAAEVVDLLEEVAQASPQTAELKSKAIESPAVLLCECITKILQNSSVSAYRDELHSFGLLERGIYPLFVKVASSLLASGGSQTVQKHQYLQMFSSRLAMWSTTTCLMLKENTPLCAEFREMQIHHSLYVIAEAMLDDGMPPLPTVGVSASVYSVLIMLAVAANGPCGSPEESNEPANVDPHGEILQAGVESDLTKILELLQRVRAAQKKQQFVLEVIKQMLRGQERFWNAWHCCQGYEILVSMLSAFQKMNEPATSDHEFQLLDAILDILCVTLDPLHVYNKSSVDHFTKDIGYSTLASCLMTSGVLETDSLASVLNRVFELITGQANPRNKIRNPDAVQTLFCLLPHMPMVDAQTSLKRLVSKITSNDDISFSKKKQIASLVEAGVFRWIAEPPIMALLQDRACPLQHELFHFVVEISKDELSTSHLREFIRVIAKGMPRLLGNHYHPSCVVDISGTKRSAGEGNEVGLSLLKVALKGSTIPQVMVGTNVRTRMTSGYVHVVNQGDRAWPPANGYSFSCWLRFPRVVKKRCMSNELVSEFTAGGGGSTVCVALCEGPLVIKLDGDDADTAESYCVLVGAELSVLQSTESARLSVGSVPGGPEQTLTVTAVEQSGPSEFFIWCHDKRYVAKSADAESAEMWVRALQQSQSISSQTVAKVKATADGGAAGEVLFVAGNDGGSAEPPSSDVGLEGFVCLMSAYSLESSGCFSRIYFDQATACLRVDTGSTTAGSNVNPVLRRTTAVFKNVNMELLRADAIYADDDEDDQELNEKAAHWHHVALTHRKAALGSSQVVLYIDGAEVATKKLSYPTAPTSGGMQGFLGKDIQICGTFPALPWSLGPTWCVEDILQSNAIACIFLLGPSFNGQFSGHAYRSIGDWPEAIATNQLDRATKRRVEAARVARRVQLAQLVKATRRQWYDATGGTSSTSGLAELQLGTAFSELLMKKGDDQSDGNTGSRLSDSKKRQLKLEGFSAFINMECALSVFGLEILDVLSSFKLPESDVIFSVNTSFANSHYKANAGSNTGRPGAQVQFIGTERSTPLNLAKVVPSLGGVAQLLLPLVENSWRSIELTAALKLLVKCMRRNPSSLAEFLEMNGYTLIMNMIRSRIHLVDDAVLKAIVRLALSGTITNGSSSRGTKSTSHPSAFAHPLIVDFAALSQIILSRHFRQSLPPNSQLQVIAYVRVLLVPENPNAIFNARQLRRAGFLSWLLVYAADVCNVDNELDAVSCLKNRACYPTFDNVTLTEILEQLLGLLTMFLHLENHVDDVTIIAEHLLLSMANQASFTNSESPFRVVLLQFLLHEIENYDGSGAQADRRLASMSGKAKWKEEAADPFPCTIVDAVLYRGPSALRVSKKKKDRLDGAFANLASPTSTSGSPSHGDSLEIVLLEIIRRIDSGPFAPLEALLSTRVLLSLCQNFSMFAQYLLCRQSLLLKFKRALQAYSSDCNFYTAILAYLSNIPIRETKYHDPVLATDGPQQYALPTASGFANLTERQCLDQVWELLGSLLYHNCVMETEIANRVTIIVLTQLSFQIEVNEGFYTTVCHSNFTVLRVITQCFMYRQEFIAPVASEDSLSNCDQPKETLQHALTSLLSGSPPQTMDGERAVACLDLLKIFITRTLFEREDFATHMIFLLECVDDEIERRASIFAPGDGQKCWLALLVHVVNHSKALKANCSFSVVKNVCTLSVALARYLVDESRHQGVARSAGTDGACDAAGDSGDSHQAKEGGDGSVASSCFGTDVLVFFLSTVRMLAEPHVTQVIGADDQQFFYACFVYCAQTVLLSELTGFHKNTSPPQRLLDCLLNAKPFFIQQTKVSGVIICGSTTYQHHSSGTTAEGDGASSSLASPPPPASTRGGLNVHINKMKSLTAAAFHKEFGIGAESDRSFMLSLAAELFRWLVDDSENVRYASIGIWQFLIQQRAGVLKELLIVEPKVSLLQNISANKKEVIDVFHGGFDRLMYVTTPRMNHEQQAAARVNSSELAAAASSRESWLQFHNWLTENFELLNELILTRTEPIFHHMIDVLLSCESIRKVNMNANSSRSAQSDWGLLLDFHQGEFEQRSSTAGGREDGIDDGAGISDALLLDSSCRVAMRKALLKYTNSQESAIEEMQDATALWREMAARLVNTRAIWHLGGWNEATKPPTVTVTDLTLSTPRTASRGGAAAAKTMEPFYVERSVFQQNAFRYRLDFTEGPQRLRLRLVRSYTLDTVVVSGDSAPPSSLSATADKEKQKPAPSTDLLQRKLDFHQCVEAYREFMYKRSKSSDLSPRHRDVNILHELAARCNVEGVKTILKAVSESDNEHCDHSRVLATRIFGEFLEGDQAVRLNVTIPVGDDISGIISSSHDLSEPVQLPSTLFDAADREAMQATLIVAGKATGNKENRTPKADAVNDDDEDDDDEVILPQGDPVARGTAGLSESEDSESEDEEKAKRSNSQGAKKGQTDTTRTRSTKEATTKPDFDPDEKIFDSSSDYIYGGIHRFLHREDYPPMHSYNAAYVAGMSKTMGVFLVCRNAIYFVGGYGKLSSGDSDGPLSTIASGLSLTASPNAAPPSSSGTDSLSPAKAGATGKKRTKDLIRDRFADIGLSFPGSKSSDSPLYTIVPLDTTSNSAGTANTQPNERWCVKYTNVKQFYRIKYQLRPVGIEYFDIFGSTFFLQYETMHDREEIVKLLFQMPIVNSVFWNPLLRSSALSLSVKRIRQSLSKRWLKGGMSNFEYLMHLNTLAGRSFNDITQYPVFPWVLADYTSAFLDLDNPTTFRDLTKPMGALGENRAALFRERFAALSHDAGHGPMDTPAFHYGTHYSCSAYVINYLIRLEPFSQLARELQGGSFDHADRLFRSIPSSWDSASTENLQDVRELVPEFFFLPEFLYNANNYDLGTTQSGEVVSHVKLPAWAHGDPREFVRLHRTALESKYVSENLHHWIDLVFGYKQTGAAALDAQNVFMHFTYEGAVDLDEIDDPVMRNAMLAQIENFGQTPSKLFTAPHPARKVPVLLSQQYTSPAPLPSSASSSPASPIPPGIGQPYEGNTIGSIEAYIKWHTPLAPALVSIGKDYVFLKKQLTANSLETAVGDVQVVSDKFQCRGLGCTFMPPRFSKYLEWGSVADGTMKLRVHNSSARHREANKIVGVIEGAHHSQINCAAFSDDGVVLVTGGDDAVVNVLECTKAFGQRLFKQIAKLVGHDDAVSSVAIDRAFNLVASASKDGSVILWDLRTRTFLRELGGHSGAVVHVDINSSTGGIVSCTSSELRIWSVNGDLLAATSIQAVGLSAITCGLSTNCERWQNGVITVTGHSNGTIALWGLLFPSDLARERLTRKESTDSSPPPTSRTTSLSSGVLKTAVRIGVGARRSHHGENAGGETPTVLKAIPSCQFVVKKLLVDHRMAITALTLGVDQRQLVSADSSGNCIRWVDDSVSTNAM